MTRLATMLIVFTSPVVAILGLGAVVTVACVPGDGFVPHKGPYQNEYCAMWGIWHADRRAGVLVDKRYGWPDEAGRYYEECDK